MSNRIARHVSGEYAVTKGTQTLSQPFDRYRAQESQGVERIGAVPKRFEPMMLPGCDI